jgi:hypothetical protein
VRFRTARVGLPRHTPGKLPSGAALLPSYTGRMKAVTAALLSLACLAPTHALAEWQWLDKDGRRVFSDQPPPPDIAPNRILKQAGPRGAAQPLATPAATTPVAATGAAPTGVDPSLKPSGKDKGLEDKRKQAEAAQTQKQKEEEARVAALRTENCSRARSAKTSLESGQRFAVVNDKGEREIIDDTRRAAELRRMDEVIARDCRADRQ